MKKTTLIIKIFVLLAYSVLVTVIILLLLYLTKNLLLDKFVHYVMKLRGTADYEGEEKGTEVWNIIMGGVVPCIFLLSFAIVGLLRRKEFKQKNK